MNAAVEPPRTRAVTLRDSARRIVELAWPVYIGQMSVIAFSVIDTVLVARHSTADLAALGVGSASYMTIFIGMMGVVLGLSPIVGQLYGARHLEQAGARALQAIWLALLLAVPGCLMLAFPSPLLALARLDAMVEAKVRAYLLVLAVSLPASLLFTVYRSFNNAVSRPKAVMKLQLGALLLKLPLSMALLAGVPMLGIPALGVVGCAWATAICMWTLVLLAVRELRRDAFYAGFRPAQPAVAMPDLSALRALLRLGGPIGLATLIEVTGFTMMAIFIARMGATQVAAHQVAANLVGISFMIPLAIANATSTLVAQRVGARDLRDARRLGWHGLSLGTAVATLVALAIFAAREAIARLYTSDPAVILVAASLLAWLALFHVFDAAQTLAAFVLRAWHIATVPMLIYVAALWGVGLGGGWVLAFDLRIDLPAWLRDANAYWACATAGLMLAAAALLTFLAWVMRTRAREEGQC